MGKYADWRKKRKVKRIERKFKSKNVARAKLLYAYAITSGVVGFLYAISTIFHDYPLWPAFVPFMLLVAYFMWLFVYRNWKMISVFLSDTSRGRFLHLLNETTQWSFDHKMRAVKWTYPRKLLRAEKHLKMMEKIYNREDLTKDERKLMKKKRIHCPQQVQDGINKAIFVNALIYANTNIEVLDPEIREIMELTDENMSKFDFQREINRCKKADDSIKIEQYRDIGMNIIKTKNGSKNLSSKSHRAK